MTDIARPTATVRSATEATRPGRFKEFWSYFSENRAP